MRIAINADIAPGIAGGVQSAVIGLTSALQGVTGDDEYTIVINDSADDWIRPYIGSDQRIVPRRRVLPPPMPPWIQATRRIIGRPIRRFFPSPIRVPRSDGFFEGLGCQVVHFLTQTFEVTDIPAVYNPHDLQHRHFPEHFTAPQLEWREKTYETGCQTAEVVCVGSSWVKRDVINAYGVDSARVQVIPWAPPTNAYPDPEQGDIEMVRRRYGLPERFAFYPAVSWRHKNHLRLIEAFARARDQVAGLHLVFTGFQTEHYAAVQERIDRLGLARLVHHLGVIPGQDLRAVYRSATCVVVPTLFEAVSGPLFEAWEEGVPAAVASVTSLPEQAADAAFLFDPLSIDAVASALVRMANDDDLRGDLIEKGKRRLAAFDWQVTARGYRAVYRRAAGLKLSSDERALLSGFQQGP